MNINIFKKKHKNRYYFFEKVWLFCLVFNKEIAFKHFLFINITKFRFLLSFSYHAGCPGNFSRGKFPLVRVKIWFRVSVKTSIWGQFSSGAIFLESSHRHFKDYVVYLINVSRTCFFYSYF